MLDENELHGVIDMIGDGVVFEKEVKLFLTVRIEADEGRLGKRVITEMVKRGFEFALITTTQTAEDSVSFFVQHPSIAPIHLAAAEARLDVSGWRRRYSVSVIP